MSAHSPAPWQVKSDYEPCIVIANVDAEIDSDGTHYTYDFVCDAFGDGDDSRSHLVAVANARQHAAAPDLLAALEIASGDLFMLSRAIDEGDPKAEVLQRVADAKRDIDAAIAKATAP